MTETTRWQRLIPFAFALFIAVAAIAPIRSYDLFWHLATGRWIVEHKVLPATDPFTVASDPHLWVNGAWLFQLGAYGLHEAGGLAGLSIARGLFAALIFLLILYASRHVNRDVPPREYAHVALLLAVVAFAGASPVLDVRPASVAMLFVIAAFVVRSPLGLAVLSIVWINTHPSALLAPLLAGLTTRRILPAVASLTGLLVNPYGIRALIAPLELMTYVRSGEFVNAEWLPSPPLLFPLLYFCIAIGAIAIVLNIRSNHLEESGAARISRLILFALFSYLAARHVRNQVLFFAAFPILITPLVRPSHIPRRAAWLVSASIILLLALTGDHRLGVTPDRFPLDAVARLREAGFSGNIYNPDQFGGFLIWSLDSERRVLTDGRNELYRIYIPEYAAARGDQRRWRELLEKYEIDLAVEEYGAPVTAMSGVSGETSMMPASLAYWPRDRWALIGFDSAAMVFARRAAFPEEQIARWEIRDVVPDDPSIRARQMGRDSTSVER
ncbi:MAG TPA: hypothetical protein VF701_18895 [Thermoanaerobaculia bacterium]